MWVEENKNWSSCCSSRFLLDQILCIIIQYDFHLLFPLRRKYIVDRQRFIEPSFHLKYSHQVGLLSSRHMRIYIYSSKILKNLCLFSWRSEYPVVESRREEYHLFFFSLYWSDCFAVRQLIHRVSFFFPADIFLFNLIRENKTRTWREEN